MSDLANIYFQAQHTGVASADAGLDMVMPSSKLWGNLSTAVTNGTLSQDRLDDMATRYLSPSAVKKLTLTVLASLPHISSLVTILRTRVQVCL